MTQTYWLARKPGTQTEGPFLRAQLLSMFSSGQLTTAAQVCREGEEEWYSLVDELDDVEDTGTPRRSFWSTLMLATGAFAMIAGGGLLLLVSNSDGEISEADKATAAMRQRLNGQAPDQLQSRWDEAASFASKLGAKVRPCRDTQFMELVVSGGLAEMSEYKARKVALMTQTRLGRKSTVILLDDTGKQMAIADESGSD